MAWNILSQLDSIAEDMKGLSSDELKEIKGKLHQLQDQAVFLAVEDYKTAVLDKLNQIELENGQFTLSFHTSHDERELPWYVTNREMFIHNNEIDENVGGLIATFSAHTGSNDLTMTLDFTDEVRSNILPYPLQSLNSNNNYNIEIQSRDHDWSIIRLAKWQAESNEEKTYLYMNGERITDMHSIPGPIEVVITGIPE